MNRSLLSLAQMNSFAIKAYTPQIMQINSKEDLYNLSTSTLHPTNFYILGEGSNTLFVEEMAPTIIHMALKGIKVEEIDDFYRLTVAAGENWHQLVEFCIENQINGLENLALIPGSVGAAPVQNIGAYGVEFADFCESVTWFDFTDKCEKKLTRKDCLFAYRNSVFKQALKHKGVITAVSLLIAKNWQPNLSYAGLNQLPKERINAKVIMAEVIRLRQSKLPDPKKLPNGGSFFKNPILSLSRFTELTKKYANVPHYPQKNGDIKVAAAWLIEQAGLKGKRRGNVGIHVNQALVLVNYGNGTGAELFNLARYVQDKVYKKFNIKIEPEVRLISSTGEKSMEEFQHG